MNIRFSSILCAIALVMAFASCKTPRLAYFQNADSMTDSLKRLDYALKISPSDELLITVNSLVPEATAPYNLPLVNPAKEGELSASSAAQNQTYVVDADGNIQFPVLGRIHVAGMTTKELSEHLKSRIEKEVEEPTVRVQLANFKVNVLGEVTEPGVIEVKSERFSVLDALAAVGDMTVYGNRENVLLIREEGGERRFYRLNLKDAAIINSPYFYLKQNDVVYVEANSVRESNAKYDQNKSYRVTVVSTVVSALSVIASLIIAVTVK